MAEAQAPPVAGTFCWHEVMTRDAATAKKFYQDLLGWTSTEMDMGPAGTYTMFQNGDQQVAGLMAMDGPEFDGIPPHWMSYITVDDIEASTKRVEQLGGSVKVPKTQIPNIGWFSVVVDPTGAVFSLFQGT